MTSPLPVLPQIIVEAGLLPDSPSQGGTTIFLDTGPGLGTGTLGTAIAWQDISPYVIRFTITRPSTRLQGPLWNYQAGTASITLDNSDGRFDPDNLAGPYVASGVTQLAAMVPVRIRANFGSNGYPLYSGFADGWLPSQVTYEGGYAELVLPCTDAFKVLAGITLPAVSIEGVGATTGARMTDILTRAGWYSSAERNVISTGNSTLQGTTLGDTALNLMQLAADSEIGQLYVNGSGAVVFRARHDLLTDTRSSTVQAVFGDLPGTSHGAGTDLLNEAGGGLLGEDGSGVLNEGSASGAGGTELACAAITRASDDTTIGNDIQATRANGGTLQEVKDSASIAKYLFPRTYSRSDLILQDDTTALAWAQWVLYIAKSGEDRFESLAIDPQADALNLWPQVLGREIGDRIQVWNRPAGVASPIAKDCFIAVITHAWDSVNSAWLTTWTLQDASKYGSFLTLDNPTLGQLGVNALAFLRRPMTDTRPHTREEIDRWAWKRRPHEREDVPAIGERVLFRETDFGGTVPAEVVDVQDLSSPHDHWIRHGGFERQRGPGEPDIHVWRYDEASGQHLMLDDPWPWVQLKELRGVNEAGEEEFAAPRWCREARVRGSAGWMREGSRAHTGEYEEWG